MHLSRTALAAGTAALALAGTSAAHAGTVFESTRYQSALSTSELTLVRLSDTSLRVDYTPIAAYGSDCHTVLAPKQFVPPAGGADLSGAGAAQAIALDAAGAHPVADPARPYAGAGIQVPNGATMSTVVTVPAGPDQWGMVMYCAGADYTGMSTTGLAHEVPATGTVGAATGTTRVATIDPRVGTPTQDSATLTAGPGGTLTAEYQNDIDRDRDCVLTVAPSGVVADDGSLLVGPGLDAAFARGEVLSLVTDPSAPGTAVPAKARPSLVTEPVRASLRAGTTTSWTFPRPGSTPVSLTTRCASRSASEPIRVGLSREVPTPVAPAPTPDAGSLAGLVPFL